MECFQCSGTNDQEKLQGNDPGKRKFDAVKTQSMSDLYCSAFKP